MPSTLTLAVFVFGAVLLLIAIHGGPFKIFAAQITGKVSHVGRLAAGVVGVVMIVLAIRMGYQNPNPPVIANEPRPLNPGPPNPGPPNPNPPNPVPSARLRAVNSGQEILRGSYTLDLDTGMVGGERNKADLFWEIADDNTHYLNAWNGAAISIAGMAQPDSLPDEALLTAPFEMTRVNGSPNAANQIPSGTLLLVRTHTGNYSKVRIEQYGIPAPGDLPEWPKRALLIRWTTYAKE